MSTDPAAIAAMYFDSWRTGDIDHLRSILADDVHFTGPLAELDNAEDCAEGVRRLSLMTTDLVIHKMFVDGDDVLTWFDLHTASAPPAPVANWSHVDAGKITRIRVTFDPRAMLAGG